MSRWPVVLFAGAALVVLLLVFSGFAWGGGQTAGPDNPGGGGIDLPGEGGGTLPGGPQDPGGGSGNGPPQKVAVCHKEDPGGGEKTLYLPLPAAAAHVEHHGDEYGSCKAR